MKLRFMHSIVWGALTTDDVRRPYVQSCEIRARGRRLWPKTAMVTSSINLAIIREKPEVNRYVSITGFLFSFPHWFSLDNSEEQFSFKTTAGSFLASYDPMISTSCSCNECFTKGHRSGLWCPIIYRILPFVALFNCFFLQIHFFEGRMDMHSVFVRKCRL